MKNKLPARAAQAAAESQTPDIQRRINAGWLKLWSAVYPNTPPPTEVQSLKSKVQSPGSRVQGPNSRVQGPADRRLAVLDLLSPLLAVWLALALLATGCAGPRPLKGGKAVTTRKPAGVIEQTVVQGENPSQATKQDQESIKVRTYTLPAGSRIEQSHTPITAAAQTASVSHDSQPSTLKPPPPSS